MYLVNMQQAYCHFIGFYRCFCMYVDFYLLSLRHFITEPMTLPTEDMWQ